MTRWISCDPVGRVDGVNLYTYVNLRPTILVDFSGLQSTPKDKQEAQARTAVNERIEQIADGILREKGLDPAKLSQQERENNLDVVEVFARALTDDKIQDSKNTGNLVRDRIRTILDATREGKSGPIPAGHREGVLKPGGKVAGTQGFRAEMKDPAPDNSQLGHFLTAVDIGEFQVKELSGTVVDIGGHTGKTLIDLSIN